MAKKLPTAHWSLSAARLSGPQIGVASRPQLSHLDALAWVDDHHIATLERDGLLRLWHEDATLLAERQLDGEHPQWTSSIHHVRCGLLVHVRQRAWLLHPDSLAILAQHERVGDLALASGLLTLIDYHGALHTLDDSPHALPTAGSIPLAASPRRPYGTSLFTAPDAPHIGLRSPDEAMTIDARDGRIRAIPAGYALLALHNDERALLRPQRSCRPPRPRLPPGRRPPRLSASQHHARCAHRRRVAAR